MRGINYWIVGELVFYVLEIIDLFEKVFKVNVYNI